MSMNWDAILEETEAEDLSSSPVPAGTYSAVVEKAEAVKAKSGSNMIKTTYRIVGGPYNDRFVWNNIVFTVTNPKAMAMTVRTLGAHGVTKEWLAAENPNVNTIAAKIVGVMVEVEIAIRTFEGRELNDVKSVKAIKGAAPAGVPAPTVAASATPSADTIPTPTIPTPTAPTAAASPLPEGESF